MTSAQSRQHPGRGAAPLNSPTGREDPPLSEERIVERKVRPEPCEVRVGEALEMARARGFGRIADLIAGFREGCPEGFGSRASFARNA